jgi:hypothetical protein
MATPRLSQLRRSALLLLLGTLTLLTLACSSDDVGAVSDSTTESTRAKVTTVAPASTSLVATTDTNEDTEGKVAAEATGEEFMKARSAHDGATLIGLMATDASFGGSELARTIDEYLLQAQWESVVGWQFLDASCSAGSPDRVVCIYSIQDSFNEKAGKGPFPGNSFLLEIADGQIQQASHNFNAEDFFTESEGNFFSWVRENHPDDMQLMLDDRPFPIAPVLLSPESLLLWEAHTTENQAQ